MNSVKGALLTSGFRVEECVQRFIFEQIVFGEDRTNECGENSTPIATGNTICLEPCTLAIPMVIMM